MKISNYAIVSERYAKALFSLALKNEATDKVAEQLNALARAADESAAFQSLLVSPLQTIPKKINTLAALAAGLKLHPLLAQFLTVLATNRRIELLSGVAQEFTRQLQAHKGEVNADITSATPLDAAHAQQLLALLSTATKQQVKPVFHHNPSLLDGLIINIGGTTIDTSLKAKLNRLSNQLKNAS